MKKITNPPEVTRQGIMEYQTELQGKTNNPGALTAGHSNIYLSIG